MESGKAVVHNFDPMAAHDDVVTLDGLDDLFNWAAELVVDANDPRIRRTKEQKVRRDVLSMIQHAKELEAREKYAEEVACLQRRVIALLQIVSEKSEQNGALKQIILTQYMAMAQFTKMQQEFAQLQNMTEYRQQAETERKHLMNSLSKLKTERDFLDELLSSTEVENERLAKLYSDCKEELEVLKNRQWWHTFRDLFRSFTNCAATA